MRRKLVLLIVGTLLLGSLLVAAPGSSAAPPRAVGPTVYTGQLTTEQLAQVSAAGIDHGDLLIRGSSADTTSVEVVLNRLLADKLIARGLPLTEKKVGGATVSRRMNQQADDGYEVFRSYSSAGGIRDEFRDLARQYPGITKLVTIGKTVQGQDIIAMKVTRDARTLPDGRRPAVLYSSTQHAREWITPEMNRRLLHYVLEGYSSTAATRRIVDSRELWFVPVANPDGYDLTFTEGNRLWRKNLHDNDGDGVIGGLDGVDLNRNFPTHWGYDNEGSSPSWSSETYRGTAPRSEPETRALDGLMNRVRFAFQVNYHSAAELLLYGVGYQVSTPTPDDLVYEALAGDDAHPAVPGYDPDIAAELYTTNGETTEHAQTKYGTLAFTPEMSTCETASAVDPDDAFDPDDCESVFNFPDSEALVQAEFEKNLPFALSIARSAGDPDDPVSTVGRTAPDFAVDTFATAYGDPQPVAAIARRDLGNLRMHYSINGRKAYQVPVSEWRGGERYGKDGDDYYAEFRGVVRGARPGDRVTVWFTGNRPGQGRRTSERFTYRLAEDTRNTVLVLANEDYEGVNPTYPASVTSPKYANGYVAALRAQGYRASVWDVSKQGVPHHLGVLSHFDAVVWYLGDNRLTQDPEDELTQVGSAQRSDAAVAERQQYLTMAVRDYLNEGAKLVHSGETAGYFGYYGSSIGGIWYGLNGDPGADCAVVDDAAECLLLADDFFQYYLGVNGRSTVETPTGFTGLGPVADTEAAFGGPAVAANPLDEAGTLGVTSDVLPADDFPLFASEAAGRYIGGAGGPFDPVEGDWYVGAAHTDDSYMRLSRTVDLRSTTAAQQPQLRMQLSYDVEPDYDHVIVEAHPVGTDTWTTLPELGGLTRTAAPAECEAGFLLEEHPFLQHYLTLGDTACTTSGSSGSWNAMTGSSDGWQAATFDLSAYAGQQVEVVLSYVTDPSTGGTGVVVDDTALVVGGAANAEGFETGLGTWRVLGPPAGSPPGGTNFARSQGLLSPAVATDDTITFGFGLEQIGSGNQRSALLGTAVRSLIGAP